MLNQLQHNRYDIFHRFSSYDMASGGRKDRCTVTVIMYPVVNKEKCTGCGNCIEICPSEVYEIREERSKAARPEDCIECWACVNQCPTESIQLCED